MHSAATWQRWRTDRNRQLVRLYERLDRSWFHTSLRARTPDRRRIEVKELRIARGLRLYAYWTRARG
jgi:hypothetical protein